MKKLIPALCLLLFFSGCKKAIEKLKEDAIINAMVDGQWVVTSFVQNGTNITTDFTGINFSITATKPLMLSKNGTVEKTGTWDGDGSAMTTWANFTGVTAPLVLINGSWHIDDSSWTYVIATQTAGGETKVMRLDKQ
ncbi:MAG: hypothetical protein WDO16_22120 [Bacteroidota bacterium]